MLAAIYTNQYQKYSDRKSITRNNWDLSFTKIDLIFHHSPVFQAKILREGLLNEMTIRRALEDFKI